MKLKENNSAKIKILTFFLILAIISIIIMGVHIYQLNYEKNIEIQKSDDLQTQVSSLNNTISSSESKINTIAETVSSNVTNSVTTNSTSESKTSKTKNTEKSNNDTTTEKSIVSKAKPSGFAGSSLNEVIMYSDGEVYLVKYDGDGEDESNILTKKIIAKRATSVETCKDEKDANYGSVIVKAEEVLLEENFGWIVFK